MTDKQIIKQLAERYKEICRSPFADGYTFTAFDGECAKKGFTRDDIKNYIEKEKQERKVKRTESIKSLKEQLKAKQQECEGLGQAYLETNELLQEKTKECTNLKAENEELKNTIMQKCPQCGEVYLNPIGAKLYETLIEIKEIAKRIVHYNEGNQVRSMEEEAKQILQKINEASK